MDRTEFEALRDLPGKQITQDIPFRRTAPLRPNVVADDVEILNTKGVELRLTIHFNPERGSKTFNVHVPGVGPICRLDVDGPPIARRARATSTRARGLRISTSATLWWTGRTFLVRLFPSCSASFARWPR
jgi:hypothetical protein